MDESSSSSQRSIKFKIAYGSDIRRLKQDLYNMSDLKLTCSKMFKPNCDESSLKYYYYDSDEDRIEISDDEDFESAISHCGNSTMKFYVERYDPYKDSFFNSQYKSEAKADLNTGASTDSSKNKDDKLRNLAESCKSIEDSSAPDEQQHYEYPVFLSAIKDTESLSGDESDEEIDHENEFKLGPKSPAQRHSDVNSKDPDSLDQEESKMFQRKNTEDHTHCYDVLEHAQCRVSSKSIPKGYKLSNSNDPRFDGFWANCLTSKVQQALSNKELLELKREWLFQVKAEKCYDLEYNRKRYVGLDKIRNKFKVMSGNQEERAKLAVVETEEPLMGNEDMIFCKKGSLISKSWVVKNVGCTQWPKNTMLIFKTNETGVVVPMILERLKPGEKMILTVNYTVPLVHEDDTDVHSITFNLYKTGFGDFGESLLLNYHADDDLFDLKLKMDNTQRLLDRVRLPDYK